MTLFHVYSNPRVLSKLRAEIQAANPSSPITNAEAANLPYFQAIIKEGIRICPPITGVMPKDVPPEGDTYNGRFIPGGTAIGFSMVGMLADKKTFGQDARTFRPERFLEDPDEQTLQLRTAVVDAAFSNGRWRCLGKNIAQMELNKVVPEVSFHDMTANMSVVRGTDKGFRSSALSIFPLCTRRIPSRITMREFRSSGTCGRERQCMELGTGRIKVPNSSLSDPDP